MGTCYYVMHWQKFEGIFAVYVVLIPKYQNKLDYRTSFLEIVCVDTFFEVKKLVLVLVFN